MLTSFALDHGHRGIGQVAAGVNLGQRDGEIPSGDLFHYDYMELAAVVAGIWGELHATAPIGHVHDEHPHNVFFQHFSVHSNAHLVMAQVAQGWRQHPPERQPSPLINPSR